MATQTTILRAQPVHLIGKSYAEYIYFIDSIHKKWETYPIADAVDEARRLTEWARKNDETELAYAFRLSSFRLLAAGPDSAVNEAIADIRSLISETKGRYPFVYVDALNKLGDIYVFRMNRNSLAFECFLMAYDSYKDFPIDDFPLKRQFIYSLGSSYFRYGDYNYAIRYLKEALRTPGRRGSYMDQALNNTLGICYMRQDMLDSAEYFFRQTLNASYAHGDSAYIGIASGNIGHVYFLKGDYAQAVPLLEVDVAFSVKHGQMRNAVTSLAGLAETYAQLGRKQDALSALGRANVIFTKRHFSEDYNIAARFYRSARSVHANAGNYRQALAYADSALVASDSAAAAKIASNLARSEEKAAFVRQKYEAGQLERERREQILVRNGLIVVILLLTVIGILAINRQRLKQRKLEAEKKNAEADLQVATAKLISASQRESETYELLEQYNEQLEQMKREEAELEETEVRTQLESAILLTDDQWENFRKLFEKVHKGFFANLKRELPDLTPAETRYLALTKLKLSSKEMAAMLGISTNAIRIYRHRLRKKLELDKDDMIEEIVDRL